MAGSTIGIKIADGSYYPVLEEGFTGTKRLTLTTVKDDQDRVQIDLYRGGGRTLDNAQYVGSLVIENIPPASQGDPEIELVLGLDAGGELTAEAVDRSTGEAQSFSMGLRTLSAGETYEVPEFAVDTGEGAEEELSPLPEDLAKPGGGAEAGEFEEEPLTGETYPVGETDRRREHLHRGPAGRARRRQSPLLTTFLVVLGVLLALALAWVVYYAVTGRALPPFLSAGGQPGEPAAGAGSATPAPAGAATGQTGTGAAGAAMTPAEPAAPATETQAKPAGVTYRIKRGDTLWDIASTYYRNPWLYPRIAKANSIRNPDFILAGSRIFIPEE